MGIEEKKVTPQEVSDVIMAEFYFSAEDGAKGAALSKGFLYEHDCRLLEGLARFTICVLVLRNGFVVHGVNSCIDPSIWNAEKGRVMAKENALEQVWFLLGYQLKDQLQSKETQ